MCEMTADCALVSVFLNMFKAYAADRDFIDGVVYYFVGPGANGDKQGVDHHCVHFVVCVPLNKRQCNAIRIKKLHNLSLLDSTMST